MAASLLFTLLSFIFAVSDLFFSTSKQIDDNVRYSVIRSTFSGHFAGLLTDLDTVQGPVHAMAIDVEEEQLYFSDSSSSELYRISVEASSTAEAPNLLLSNVNAMGMAFDWVNKALYWTQSK